MQNIKKYTIFSLLFVIVWIVSRQLSFVFVITPLTSAFYIPAALTISASAILGIRILPLAIIAHISASLMNLGSLELSIYDILQALRHGILFASAGALWLRLRQTNRIRTVSQGAGYFITIGMICAFLSGIWAAAIFRAAGDITTSEYGEFAAAVWAGDLTSTMMLAPILYMAGMAKRLPKPQSLLDALKQGPGIKAAAGPGLASVVGFGIPMINEAGTSFGYLIVLPVVWVASQHGVIGGMTSALIASLSAIGVYNVIGTFSQPPLELEVLFALTAITGLVVGAAFEDRRLAEAARKRQEDELRQLSRVITVGEISASIFHEINTPLQVALINAKLAAEATVTPNASSMAEIHKRVMATHDSILSAGEIQKRIRDFLGNRDICHGPTSLAESIRKAANLIQPQLRQDKISFNLDLPPSTLQVMVDQVELQQVIINLVSNAQASIIQKDRGERLIRISVSGPHNGSCCIMVDDTGMGVPPDIASTIFTSFFTTKPGGLGLGLAICRNIIERAGGSILAKNWHHGARIIIHLPVAEAVHE